MLTLMRVALSNCQSKSTSVFRVAYGVMEHLILGVQGADVILEWVGYPSSLNPYI